MTFRRNPQFMAEIERIAADRLDDSAEIVRKSVVEILEEPKSGIRYPGNPRASSAPGEAPASQSGELADSIETSPAAKSGNAIEAHIFTWLTRGRMLEGGYANASPRPFLRPGLYLSRLNIVKAMTVEGADDVR